MESDKAAEGGRPPGTGKALFSRRRRLILVGLLGILGLLVADLARAPRDQWITRALLVALDGYQAHVSPHLQRAGVGCRFRPSCSHYAEDALRARGAFGGSWRTAWRLLRCGPWTPDGTVDPAPDPVPRESAPKMLD